MYEQLSEKVTAGGDSTTTEDRTQFRTFLENLKDVSDFLFFALFGVLILVCWSKVKEGNRPFTIILDDPLANSYLQNLYAPDPDPNMTVEMYERTWEQNEELGLNDIKVEGYEMDASGEKNKEEVG